MIEGGEFPGIAGIVIGTAWYFEVRAYRRRQGIDISLAFQQIPIG